VVWAFLFEVGALLLAIAVSSATGNTAHPIWLLAILGYLLVPASFMVAILRSRLYDIDRIVSRTVSYTILALTVAAVYAAPVMFSPRLLGESNDLVVAGSTLAAAAAFNPVRSRIQRLVDRRFNRARFDAQREVELLTAHLGSVVTVAAVTDSFRGAIVRTVQPSRATLWLRSPGPDEVRNPPR
jgi:hypothetical protein